RGRLRGLHPVRPARSQRPHGWLAPGTRVCLRRHRSDRFRVPPERPQKISCVALRPRPDLAQGARLAGAAEPVTDPVPRGISLGPRAGCRVDVAVRYHHGERNLWARFAKLHSAPHDGAIDARNHLRADPGRRPVPAPRGRRARRVHHRRSERGGGSGGSALCRRQEVLFRSGPAQERGGKGCRRSSETQGLSADRGRGGRRTRPARSLSPGNPAVSGAAALGLLPSLVSERRRRLRLFSISSYRHAGGGPRGAPRPGGHLRRAPAARPPGAAASLAPWMAVRPCTIVGGVSGAGGDPRRDFAEVLRWRRKKNRSNTNAASSIPRDSPSASTSPISAGPTGFALGANAWAGWPPRPWWSWCFLFLSASAAA